MTRLITGLYVIMALLNRAATEVTTSEAKPVETLFLDPIEGVTYAGSVISVGPSATLYSVECTTTATTPIPSNLCTYVEGITILQGPATCSAIFTAVFNPTSTLIEVFDCVLSGTLALCTDIVSETGVAKTFPSVYGNLTDSMSPVTITAGADLLVSASASTTPASDPNGTYSTAAASGTTQGTAPSTTVVTAGQPHVTQPAILAGLAGFVAGGIMI